MSIRQMGRGRSRPFGVGGLRPGGLEVPLEAASHQMVFYQIGTALGTESFVSPHTSGRVTCTASSTDTGNPGYAVDRVAGLWHTAPGAGGWWSVDLDADLTGRRLVPTHLSFQQRTTSGNLLQACTIQGSEDGSTWYTLGSVADGGMDEAASAWTDISLPDNPAPYRHIRLTMVGTDTSGLYYLVANEIELAGTLLT